MSNDTQTIPAISEKGVSSVVLKTGLLAVYCWLQAAISAFSWIQNK